jgi:tripartite-type tricarboxylate transporter receptor subunit TctC
MARVRLVLALVAGLIAAVAGWTSASADPYPNGPVKLVIPFPPGGTTDIVGRLLAQRLSQALGVTVYVENKSGAGGLVGTEAVAKAAPDGQTILLSNSGALATGLSLFPSVPYDVMRDFAPVSMISDVTIALAVNPKLPVHSVAELVAYAKEHPSKLNVALPSVGSMHHLLTETFKSKIGAQIVSVPYKGSAPAIQDLIANNVQMDFDNLPALNPFIRSQQVRAIAVASPTRSQSLPDVPTIKEAGYPDLVASPWFALMVPARTPAPIVARLNTEVVKIMQSEEMKKRLTGLGANALWSTPEECRTFIQQEIVRWAKVVKDAGIKLH